MSVAGKWGPVAISQTRVVLGMHHTSRWSNLCLSNNLHPHTLTIAIAVLISPSYALQTPAPLIKRPASRGRMGILYALPT